MIESPLVDSGFAVPVLSLGDDSISCLNKAIAFLTALASSRGDKVKVIPVLVIRVMLLVLGETMQVDRQGFLNATTFKTEDLDTYDSECDDILNAKAVLMANISNYGSDVILEELLVYVRDTCPNPINLNAKKVAVTPKNKVKKVRFAKPITSSSNIKQVESSTTSDSNTPMLSPIGLKCSTSNCGSKPSGNKKNNRISQTPSRNMKKKIEAQPRKVNKKNRVVEPICNVDVKRSHLNANSELICATCKKSMFDGVHDMCLLDFVKSVNSRLVPNIISQQPYIPPKRHDWDHLFQPMFDEYFTPSSIIVSPVPDAAAQRAVDLVDSPVSTSIDQDAPFVSIPSTQEQEHSPNISQGFEESPKTSHFHDDPLIESLHEDLTSQGSSSNNFKQAMIEPSWINAMQEEIHEFERLEVWELVPCPDKVFLIKLKWIYKVKMDEFGEDNPSYVYKLKKALYGLKQAPRACSKYLVLFLYLVINNSICSSSLNLKSSALSNSFNLYQQ
nr:hypothetical protein [Tanacetum cinerariifolium]